MRRTRLWRSSHEQDISGICVGSPEISSTRQSNKELGADKKSSPTSRNSTLTGVSVDCQRTRWCMERPSVVQRPECNACDAVRVTANRRWHGKNSDLAGRLTESTGHSGRIVEGPEDTPLLLQKADGRSDAQEGQSENRTDGLSQRRRGSREASLDVKDRDESTGNVDDVTPDVETGVRTIGVNNCHRKLATIGACGRHHKGVVTPGPVVRRQERLRHSAEIIQCAEVVERCPMTTRHLVTRVKQPQLPDSDESQTCDLKLPNRKMAPCTKVPPRHEKSPRR